MAEGPNSEVAQGAPSVATRILLGSSRRSRIGSYWTRPPSLSSATMDFRRSIGQLTRPRLSTTPAFMRIANSRSSPAIGDVMVVGLGGTVNLYVTGHDERTVQRIVEFLQETDFAGVILSRFEIEGTFPLSAAMIDAPTAPDIVVSLRWTGDKSRTGLPGMSASDAKRPAQGQGIHASLSRFELHNTLIAAGPGIRRDFVDMLPSGNADVAPTVLALLRYFITIGNGRSRTRRGPVRQRAFLRPIDI